MFPLGSFAEKEMLPERFDAREQGWMTPVKEQNSEDCWAYSYCAAAEAYLISQGYEDNTVDLSESYIVSLNEQYDESPEDTGGSIESYYTALCFGNGIAFEKDYPGDESWSKEKLKENKCLYVVSEAGKVSNPKEWIYKYGAVLCSIEMPEVYEGLSYNGNGNPDSVNHSVTLIGWDDNYGPENFNKVPEKPGAWIARNSWGEEFADGGYFYISYEDQSLSAFFGMVITKETSFLETMSYNEKMNPRIIAVEYEEGKGGAVYGNRFTPEEDIYVEYISFINKGNNNFRYFLSERSEAAAGGLSVLDYYSLSENTRSFDISPFTEMCYCLLPVNKILKAGVCYEAGIIYDKNENGEKVWAYQDERCEEGQSFYGTVSDPLTVLTDIGDNEYSGNFYINLKYKNADEADITEISESETQVSRQETASASDADKNDQDKEKNKKFIASIIKTGIAGVLLLVCTDTGKKIFKRKELRKK